eukprot:5541130-Pleurochrysis_carterae.AAC.1
MAANTDLGESNRLATTIPGSHLKVFKAYHQSCWGSARCRRRNVSFLVPSSIVLCHICGLYADDLPAMSQNRNVNKAYQSILSLEAQHRVLCLGLRQEPLSRPQGVLALVIASTFSDVPTPNRFELLARLKSIHPNPRWQVFSRGNLSSRLLLSFTRRRTSRPRKSKNVGKGSNPRPGA